jgi:hypothetical protein
MDFTPNVEPGLDQYFGVFSGLKIDRNDHHIGQQWPSHLSRINFANRQNRPTPQIGFAQT